jgi:hypothetical protein
MRDNVIGFILEINFLAQGVCVPCRGGKEHRRWFSRMKWNFACRQPGISDYSCGQSAERQATCSAFRLQGQI